MLPLWPLLIETFSFSESWLNLWQAVEAEVEAAELVVASSCVFVADLFKKKPCYLLLFNTETILKCFMESRIKRHSNINSHLLCLATTFSTSDCTSTILSTREGHDPLDEAMPWLS